MRGTDATQRRKRTANVEPACLRANVFAKLTLRALARKNKPRTDQGRAELFGLNRFTIRRLHLDNYEPTLGTAMHIARVLDTTVEDLWGTKREVCPDREVA